MYVYIYIYLYSYITFLQILNAIYYNLEKHLQ